MRSFGYGPLLDSYRPVPDRAGRREIYEKLKSKGRVDSRSGLFFGLVFIDMTIRWAAWFNLCPQDPYPVALPLPVRWFGQSLFILGLALTALI